MPNFKRKLFNLFPVALIAAVSFWPWGSLAGFVWASGGTLAFLALVYLGALAQAGRLQDYYLAFLPILYLLGFFGVLGAIALPSVKGLVAVLGVGAFALGQLDFPDPAAEFIEEVFTLAGVFWVLAGLWAVNFFFAPPWWTVTILTLLFFFLFFWQAFRRLALSPNISLLWALMASLVAVEINTAILFWPVFFLTAAVASFAGFYLMYLLSRLYFTGRLTRKRIYFQTGIIALVVLASLLSSSWHP